MSYAMAEAAIEREADHKLILGSRVKGAPVFNQAGDRMGHVDDLSIERTTGRVVYAIMSFGGFLGVGEKFHPIPWSLLHYDVERAGYLVPLDKSALEGAPHYEREELVGLGGPSMRAFDLRIYDYYGAYGPIAPFW